MNDEQKDTTSADDAGEQHPSSELAPSQPGDIGDDRLPADLQPTEDNPLARHPGQSGDQADAIGADREEDPETAPLHADQADYGSGERSGTGTGGGATG